MQMITGSLSKIESTQLLGKIMSTSAQRLILKHKSLDKLKKIKLSKFGIRLLQVGCTKTEQMLLLFRRNKRLR